MVVANLLKLYFDNLFVFILEIENHSIPRNQLLRMVLGFICDFTYSLDVELFELFVNGSRLWDLGDSDFRFDSSELIF